MITTSKLTVNFGQRVLFEDVNVKFTPGNCYGIIGANGAGKSTLVRILSGEIDSHTGTVSIPNGLRMSVLRQDHFEFNEVEAITTVLMGHKRLFAIMQEKDALYAKPDFSEEDGVRTGELEAEFADLDGWNAETQAAILLSGLGLHVDDHTKLVKDLDDSQKVRVLLAQALFADPDILLLDEPTNHLDFETVEALGFALRDYQGTLVFVSHDRTFVNLVANQVIEVHEGSVRLFPGNYQDYVYRLSQLQHGEPTGEEPPPNGKSAAKSVGPSTSGGSESNGSASPRKGSSAAPPEQSSQDSHAERKRKRSLLGRSRTELTKLEADVARLEKRRDELLAILSDPDQFSLERNEELAKISEQLLKAEEAYLATVATIEELETSVGAQQ